MAGDIYTRLGMDSPAPPVTDHGGLAGLADDDHPQYLTAAEGNAAYAPISPVAGWTDAGTVVHPTTSTDDVGIGSVTPGARVGIFNTVTTKISLLIKAVAAMTAAVFQIQNSSGRPLLSMIDGVIYLGNSTDTTPTSGILFRESLGITAATIRQLISWGDSPNSIGPPSNTADQIGCVGARIYTYKDSGGTYDSGYGQDAVDAWVLVSDESITYSIFTGVMGGTAFLRSQWAGNGDLTNYGLIHVRKSTGAVTKGVPSLRLEETGAGTEYVSLRAPASVTANRTQLLFNMTGTHPLVGDDPPAVAAGAMGKVDSTAQAAAVASTNLTNGALAGMYAVEYTLLVTTADAAAGTIQFSTGYTDTLGATTQVGVALSLIATGRQTGRFIAQLASGELSYLTTLTGIIGAARYALYVRVVYLG